jgi:hypothetical protein
VTLSEAVLTECKVRSVIVRIRLSRYRDRTASSTIGVRSPGGKTFLSTASRPVSRSSGTLAVGIERVGR